MANAQAERPILDRRGILSTAHALALLSTVLVRSPLAWMGGALFTLLRILWRRQTVRREDATTGEGLQPTGPFSLGRPAAQGDLLLWVPRGLDSYLIDNLTGGYGYSHSTIDTGQIDVPTGRPVMAEITVHQKVSHKFLDEYGDRPFVRLPLRRAGVNIRELTRCVESKMGEQYDTLDALTLGEIQDPAREVCSGLVTDCLPADQLRSIARATRFGLLHRHSVSLHSKPDASKIRAFVSPNGLAEYYGAPWGRKVNRPDTLVDPRPVTASIRRTAMLAGRHQGWKAALAVLAAAAFVIASRRRG